MAVQLILKNSAVQDKEATAAQLAVGEIALNYYESGPFLQCKDTAGNVWRLGGVVIASTAPATPSKGTWWLDSDDNSLRFYNGTSWIEVQTGEITVGDIAEGTARQLLQTNAAGTAAEWTSNIDVPGTLDVTGVATFDNNVVITGNLTVNGTTTTIDTQTLLVEDKNIEMGVVATPTDSTADGGGITLKGTTDKTINWVNATDAWTSSERFSVPSGSAGTPSITFTGDENTGIYRPGADQVAISTNGTGRLFINSSGNAAIGFTANSSNRLLISSAATGTTTRSNPVLRIQSEDTGRDVHIQFSDNITNAAEIGMVGGPLYFATAGSERMRLDTSGRLGLGTSSPSYKTQIAGTSGTVGLGLTGTYASGDIGYYFAPSAVTGSVVAFQSAANATTGVSALFANGNTADGTAHARVEAQVGGASAGDPKFVMTVSGATNWSAGIDNSDSDKFKISSSDSPGSSDRLTIDTSGNVGVGTTSPSYSLDVKQSSTGNSNTIAAKGGTNGGGYFWETNAGTTYGAIGYGDLISANSGSSNTAITSWGSQDLLLGTNRTERLRITSSGLVGIGTSSPSSIFHAAGTSAIGIFQSTAAGYNAQVNFQTTVGTWSVGQNINLTNTGTLEFSNGSTRAVLDSSGRLGIGTTSPAYTFDCRGTIYSAVASGTTNLLLGDTSNGTQSSIRTSNSNLIFSHNASSEAARLDSSGRLLVGTTSNSNNSTAVFQGNSGSSTGGSIVRLAAGTATPSDGSTLGTIGFTDSSHNHAGRIEVKRDGGTWTSTSSHPSRLEFSTTADGASSPTERMRISNNGVVTVKNGAVAEIGTLTDAATITPNFASNCNFTVTLGGARTIANPTNVTAGQSGSIFIVQDATGGRTASWGSNWDWAGGTAPTLSTGANAVDRVDYICRSSTSIHAVYTGNYS